MEDYWRAILPCAQSGDHAAVQEIGARFEERVAQTAALLPPVEAAAFQQAVDAEREAMLAAYRVDPAGLKRRLGVALGVDSGRPQPRGHGLGELAIRTAVRATVWKSIWSLFRAFR